MVQVLDKTVVFATIDEVVLIDTLFRKKDAAAIYYKKGKKTAYHWIFTKAEIKALGKI